MWEAISNEPLKVNWHMEYLCKELQIMGNWVINRQEKQYDLLINISPGTSKSSIVSILFPVWLWINAPWVKVISSSYSMDASLPHSLKSRDVIRSSKFQLWYGKEFQMKSDNDQKKTYENDQGGMRISTSSGGTITGKHGHLIIVDDPHKPPNPVKSEAAEEPLELQKTNAWHDVTLSSRKVDHNNTPMIYVMQRLHEGDLSGHLLSKQGYKLKHICLPAEYDAEVTLPFELKEKYVDNLFDPVRLPLKLLAEKKLLMGSQQYASQFGQRPSPADGDIIKKTWFKFFKASDVPEGLVRHFYTDTAYGKEGSDNSATGCFSVHNGNLYLWHVAINKLPFPEFIANHKQLIVLNGYSSYSRDVFEPKASGVSTIQQLRTEKLPNGAGINVIEDEPPTESKITRVKAHTPIMEAGRVYLLEGEPWIDPFIAECIMFPNGKNDDQVDMLVGAIAQSISMGQWFVG